MVASNSVEPAAQPAPIELIDLKTQQARIKPEIEAAIAKVLSHGRYIMGPEVVEFEAMLAQACGAKHVISCSSGTDALLMSLMALGVGPGDAVICPAFTFTATPEVIALLGATPVLADVEDESFNLDPARLGEAISAARAKGLKPRAVMPVDLFGQPADYQAIEALAAENDMFVLCDAAQSFGASDRGRKVGRIGHATATSFFPAKPLGCYGDGGAIFTDDDDLANAIRSIRAHGNGDDKYDIVRVGINGRLDTMQAAILIEKLKIFADEVAARNRIAERYCERLDNMVCVPKIRDGATSVWAQYTLRLPAEQRDRVAARLKAEGVPTAVYYPRPLHHQPAYADAPLAIGGVDVSTRLSEEVLSIPMHPYLDEETQDRVISAIGRCVRESA